MSKEWLLQAYNWAKPFMLMIFLQTSYAVNGLILESALHKGLNHYTFAVYRNAVAALFFGPFALRFERTMRPKMTVSVFIKLMVLGLLEPVIDQNFYYVGMKATSATFATAMCNILPAITFIMALMFRLEKVKLKSLHSQGKIIGTIVTVGGAMIMTLIRGPSIVFPWTNHHNQQSSSSSSTDLTIQDTIKGSLMIITGCFSWAAFIILQAVTLKSYPAELSLTTLVCMMGALQGSIVTLVAEKTNTAIWSIRWDIKLFAALYSGIVCSGCGYYVSGIVMKERGPVFVTAFCPLGMVIIAIMSSCFLGQSLNLGSVVGAVVIVVGLYLVIWGKSKDQNQSAPLDQQCNDGVKTLIVKDDNVNIFGKASTDTNVDVV